MIDLATLQARAAIIRRLRACYDAHGYLEIETPVRIAAPAPEAFIDCPPVTTGGFLRASPELQMKKILALGAPAIYQIGPCFRDFEKGARHNPEFTMLEWYRLHADEETIKKEWLAVFTALFEEFRHETPRLTEWKVREAYIRLAHWDPLTNFDRDRFDHDMALVIEPAIKAAGGGIVLADYPPACASLSRIVDGVAKRWEFYYNGLELVNCFSELCDPAEQRVRFAKEREIRAAQGESAYPEDEAFFDALAQIESASGASLGVDRLVMTLLGIDHIADVRWGD